MTDKFKGVMLLYFNSFQRLFTFICVGTAHQFYTFSAQTVLCAVYSGLSSLVASYVPSFSTFSQWCDCSYFTSLIFLKFYWLLLFSKNVSRRHLFSSHCCIYCSYFLNTFLGFSYFLHSFIYCSYFLNIFIDCSYLFTLL